MLGEGRPIATFHASGGNTFEDNAALGVFEFHGPAAIGQLGDIFANVLAPWTVDARGI